MIRRSPCEYYIRYLLCHPDDLSNGQIFDRLTAEALDPLGLTYIAQVREDIRLPEPFHPLDKGHLGSQRFLREQKIQSMFLQESATKQALKILEKPRAKEFVESLSLSGAPATAISGYLQEKHRLSMSEQGVLRYQHYFWNLDLLDSADVRALLELRSQAYYDHPFVELQRHADVLKNIKYNDPRYTAAKLPNSPVAAVVAQMRIGIMPTGLEVARLLEATQTAALIRAMEASMAGGKGDSKNALEFMTTAKIAHEMLGEMVKPEDELKKQLQTIELRASESKVPHIKELSGGNHTADLMVNAEGEPEEAESK